MKPFDIKERTFMFSVQTIQICRDLPRDEVNKILFRQLIRSATSIGANIEEAHGSRTKPEFVNCLNIAKKETRETLYWLRIVLEVGSEVLENRIHSLVVEAEEIVRILTSSVKKLSINKI